MTKNSQTVIRVNFEVAFTHNSERLKWLVIIQKVSYEYTVLKLTYELVITQKSLSDEFNLWTSHHSERVPTFERSDS